jgi:NAD(P)-dependent dehydrogenase (short-subunit alcohol dehydrogenase family)
MSESINDVKHDFSGRVAIVTGAGSGIGRAVAQAFAYAGSRVVVANRDSYAGQETVDMIQTGGGEAIYVSTDVSSLGEVSRLVNEAVDHFGGIDYACNCAGTEGPAALTADLAEVDVDQLINVNLKGVWACMKYEISQMRVQGAGAIVNVSSVNGLSYAAGRSLYAATKYAVIGLTKSAAAEYGSAGIRINAVCPGPIRTQMLERANNAPLDDQEVNVRGQVPLGRLGRPEEVATAILWLCSTAASYVTGHIMVIDGGLMVNYSSPNY